MAKLYVVSDVHSFWNELKAALDEAGFEPENKEHWLVSCGDHFDRGPEPEKVMNYFKSLERKILIKGNHESMLLDCIQRRYPYKYDWSNGTAQTIIDLAPEATTFDEACEMVYYKVKDFIGGMVDYFETDNYIFTHSCIPLKDDGLFNPDWRRVSHEAWEDARWGNPFDVAHKGLLPDKTLVFGHWHTSWPRHQYEGKPEAGEEADFSIYYGDGYIGLDACTAYSKKVNILILEDEFLK